MGYNVITQELGQGEENPLRRRGDKRSYASSWTSQDVWKMVDEVQGGDLDAFSTLYARHVDCIHRFILLRTRNSVVAEDLTSETFLRALKRINSITYHGTSFRAWLMTIARNLVIDHVKSTRRKPEVAFPVGFDVESNSGDPVAYACDRDSYAELLAILDQLTENQRRCLVLRFLEERSVAEVAVTMNRSRESVRALQVRAIRRLAKLVSGGAG